MTPSNRRIPQLDGYRVLMVFIVSWFHIWQQSWLTPSIGRYSMDYLVRAGYLMVDGTVLLSAFLLFLPYAQAMLSPAIRIPSPGEFYLKRIQRVVPSYWAVIFITLFVVCIPLKSYTRWPFMVKDLLTHFTLTFTFWSDTYLGSPLGGAFWTLAIEFQAYLLMPFLARAVMKKPLLTLSSLVLSAFAFRFWCISAFSDFAFVVNQLPSFLDVYALGMLLAIIYTRLIRLRDQSNHQFLFAIVATLVLIISLLLTEQLMHRQARMPSHAMIQRGQMIRRFPLCILLGLFMVSLPFALRPVRFLFGNRVMQFLSALSMNFYLTHQTIAVQLKRFHIPYSEFDLPNQVGDVPWQYAYTFICYGVSLLIAAALTWLIEKPCSRLLGLWFAERKQAKSALRLKKMHQAIRQTLIPFGDLTGKLILLQAGHIPTQLLTEAAAIIEEDGGEAIVHLRPNEKADGVLQLGADCPLRSDMPAVRLHRWT